MTILEWVELVVIVLVTLIFLIWFVISALKKGWFKQLTETINTAIKDAEASGKSGALKKAYVMAQVEARCAELGIPYYILKTLISAAVDKIVADYNILAK